MLDISLKRSSPFSPSHLDMPCKHLIPGVQLEKRDIFFLRPSTPFITEQLTHTVYLIRPSQQAYQSLTELLNINVWLDGKCVFCQRQNFASFIETEPALPSVSDNGDEIYRNPAPSTLKTPDMEHQSAFGFIAGDSYGTQQCILHDKVGWSQG